MTFILSSLLLLFIGSFEIGHCDPTTNKPIKTQVNIHVRVEGHGGENKTGAGNTPLLRHNQEWYDLMSQCAYMNPHYACVHKCAFEKTGSVIGNQLFIDNITTYLLILYNSEKFAMKKSKMIKTECDNDDNYNSDGSITCGIPIRLFICVTRAMTRPYISIPQYNETRPETRGRKNSYREYVENITECIKETVITYGEGKHMAATFTFYGAQRTSSPCIMACVYRRNNVFVDGIFIRDNFSQFRKRVWTDEYIAFTTDFFPTQDCIDNAAAMRDECMAAVLLDTCTESTPNTRPSGWYESELSRIQ